MKKSKIIVSLIVMLMLLSLVVPAFAATNKKPITYINQKYKFALTLPATWKDHYVVKEEKWNGETYLRFCYKNGSKVYKDEWLLWIVVSKKTKAQISREQLEAGQANGAVSKYLGTNRGYSFEYWDLNLALGDTALNDQRFIDFVNNDAQKVAKTFRFIK